MERILNNEKLLEALGAAQTAKEIEAVLAEHNVTLAEDMSAEELLRMLKSSGQEGELNEADLEDVAGGARLLVPGPCPSVTRATAKIIAWLLGKKKK